MKRSKVLVSLLLVFCIGVSLFAFSAAGVSAEEQELFPPPPLQAEIVDYAGSGVYTPVCISLGTYGGETTYVLYLGDPVGFSLNWEDRVSIRVKTGSKLVSYALQNGSWVRHMPVYNLFVSESNPDVSSTTVLFPFSQASWFCSDVYDNGVLVRSASPFPTNPPLALAVKTQLVEEITPAKLLTTIVGLLPYLLPLLIGSAAFWKCWRFLSAQLRTA